MENHSTASPRAAASALEAGAVSAARSASEYAPTSVDDTTNPEWPAPTTTAWYVLPSTSAVVEVCTRRLFQRYCSSDPTRRTVNRSPAA